MSISDTAEYWHDVKRKTNNRLPYVHVKDYDCGHFHVIDSRNLFEVDCPACRRHIDNCLELVSAEKQQKHDYEQNKINKAKKKWKQSYPSNPECPKCGFVMIKRINHKSGLKFFGCCQYPKCDSTMKILL